jgi:hypothetical protein
MIHIVFNTADVEVLRKAQEMELELAGEIALVRDDYAVGPLAGVQTPEGHEARREWWRGVLQGGDYDGLVDKGLVDDPAVMAHLRQSMEADPKETLWIWAAQNKHDVSGYYWLMSQLEPFQGRVFILYLNNLPFINERGGIFYPKWMHEIPPREFLKARKLARPITPVEFENDKEEWRRLCGEETGVRLLEGGKKLVRKGLECYDTELLKHVGADWQKAARVISQFLVKGSETTGDAYLLWRIKTLIADGRLEVRGTPGLMRDFDVRLPGSEPQADKSNP